MTSCTKEWNWPAVTFAIHLYQYAPPDPWFFSCYSSSIKLPAKSCKHLTSLTAVNGQRWTRRPIWTLALQNNPQDKAQKFQLHKEWWTISWVCRLQKFITISIQISTYSLHVTSQTATAIVSCNIFFSPIRFSQANSSTRPIEVVTSGSRLVRVPISICLPASTVPPPTPCIGNGRSGREEKREGTVEVEHWRAKEQRLAQN